MAVSKEVIQTASKLGAFAAQAANPIYQLCMDRLSRVLRGTGLSFYMYRMGEELKST